MTKITKEDMLKEYSDLIASMPNNTSSMELSNSWIGYPNVNDYRVTTGTYATSPITADIRVDQLVEEVEMLKEAMLILKRDRVMEEKYPELKEAFDEYNRMLKNLKVIEAIQEE